MMILSKFLHFNLLLLLLLKVYSLKIQHNLNQAKFYLNMNKMMNKLTIQIKMRELYNQKIINIRRQMKIYKKNNKIELSKLCNICRINIKDNMIDLFSKYHIITLQELNFKTVMLWRHKLWRDHWTSSKYLILMLESMVKLYKIQPKTLVKILRNCL